MFHQNYCGHWNGYTNQATGVCTSTSYAPQHGQTVRASNNFTVSKSGTYKVSGLPTSSASAQVFHTVPMGADQMLAAISNGTSVQLQVGTSYYIGNPSNFNNMAATICFNP